MEDTQTNRYVLDTQCTEEILMKIAQFEFSWKSVGRHLIGNQSVTDIENEEHSEQNRREKMLLTWLEQKGSQATYRCLVEVFKTTKNKAAAEKVEKLMMGDPRPPVITIQPQSLKVLYGSKATLSCTAVGLPGQVITYEWFKGGVKIPSGSSGDHVITGVTCEDEGQYHCAVSCGGCKVESDRVKLEVELGDCSIVREDPGDDQADHCMVSSDGGKTKEKAYKMKSKPVHGIALIISNVEFKKGYGLEDRNGGEVDEVNVTELLGPHYLKYKVVLLKNLTARQIDFAFRLVSGYEGTTYATLPEEMKESLKELNLTENLIAADHDSFICVLMSHGDKDILNGTDGKEFELRNIYNYLGPCKHLEGKPKMAFIQACQGHNIADVPPAYLDGPQYTTKSSDFLVSNSAFRGQSSVRTRNGTIYINALCDVFKNNYRRMEVLVMIKKVHEKVSEFSSKAKVDDGPRQKIQQCPEVHFTLRHSVYFAVRGLWGW